MDSETHTIDGICKITNKFRHCHLDKMATIDYIWILAGSTKCVIDLYFQLLFALHVSFLKTLNSGH